MRLKCLRLLLNAIPNLPWGDLQVVFMKTAMQANTAASKISNIGAVMAVNPSPAINP